MCAGKSPEKGRELCVTAGFMSKRLRDRVSGPPKSLQLTEHGWLGMDTP